MGQPEGDTLLAQNVTLLVSSDRMSRAFRVHEAYLDQAWQTLKDSILLKGQYPKDDPRIQAHIGAGTGTGINYKIETYALAKRLLQRFLENRRDYPGKMKEHGDYNADYWWLYHKEPSNVKRNWEKPAFGGGRFRGVTNEVENAFLRALSTLNRRYHDKEWERVGGKKFDKDVEEGLYEHEWEENRGTFGLGGDYRWDGEYHRKYEELHNKMVPYHESDAPKSDLKLLTDYHDEMSRISAASGLGRGTWVSHHHPAMKSYTEQLNEQLGLHPEPTMLRRDVQSTSFDTRTQPDSQ